MIRDYSNKRIHKNFNVVNIISILANVFALVGLIIDVIIILNYNVDMEITQFISCHLCSCCIPFLQLTTARKQYGRAPIKETKLNNDFSNLITIIVISLFPLVPYTIYKLSGNNELIYLPNILIYISDGFLIYNCVLIKREWNDKPPAFYSIRQAEIKRKQTTQIMNSNMEQYKALIEKCGIKFFIKYYKQIKRLPLRDVTVSENYSSDEREERLIAAKKIIDTGLSEFTLQEIIRDYSDILDKSEILEAKSLLSEIQAPINS